MPLTAEDIIANHCVDDGSIDHSEELFYSEDELKEIFRVIECNLVMPFEGTLQSENVAEKEMHRKITDYNRHKFNEIKLQYKVKQ